MSNADASLDGFNAPLELAPRIEPAPQMGEREQSIAELLDSDDATAALEASSAGSYRRLLTLPAIEEAAWKRWLFLLLGIGVAVAFLMLVLTYFAPGPGTPGIDENAYLVGGKEVAQHFTPGIHPSTPYGYVGPMWIRARDGWYYPKYPAGIPVLDALAIWIAGGHNNLAAVYVSPVCAALAVLAMFLITRLIAGSFLALLGAIALATNSTMLHLALIPSSHAPDICFVLWGMYALICWWKSGRIWTGIAAGFLLGYAVTIRYSEALLLFPLYPIEIDKAVHPHIAKWFLILKYLPIGPLGMVVIAGMRWKKFGSYLRAAVPLIAWAVPVGLLVWFNWKTLHTMTGYDPTHESTGFTLKEFQSKWEYTVQELYMYGVFFLLPMGILGMLLMFARAWRVGLLMVLWFVPSVLLYTAYYWGENSPGVGYLRFFLALFPPIIACAMFLIGVAGRGLLLRHDADSGLRFRGGSVAIPFGAGLFTAMVAAAGIYVSLPDMERQHMQNQKLAYSAKALLQTVPAATHHRGKLDPIFFAEDGGMFSRLLMYMQFVGDGEWYSTSAFTLRGAIGHGMMGGGRPGGFQGGRRGPAGAGGLGGGGGPGGASAANAQADPDPAPVLFDPERVEFQKQTYEHKTSIDLAHDQAALLSAALDAGRPVYALLSPDNSLDFSRQLLGEGFDCKKLTTWREPADPAEPDAPAPPPANGRTGGFGGFTRGNRNGGFNGGGPGGPGGQNQPAGLSPPARGGRFGESAGQQTLQVFQIVRKPAPPTPATPPITPLSRPTTRPATLPVESK